VVSHGAIIEKSTVLAPGRHALVSRGSVLYRTEAGADVVKPFFHRRFHIAHLAFDLANILLQGAHVPLRTHSGHSLPCPEAAANPREDGIGDAGASPPPADEASKHHPVLGVARRAVVVGGLASRRVEPDLESGIALDRRGHPPADPVVPRAGVRHPEADVGRAREPVAEQREPVAHIRRQAARGTESPAVRSQGPRTARAPQLVGCAHPFARTRTALCGNRRALIGRSAHPIVALAICVEPARNPY